MSWFDKLLPPKIKNDGPKRASIPEGLWRKCGSCGAVLYSAEIESNMNVCPKCTHHMRIGARRRLDLFLDPERRVLEIAQPPALDQDRNDREDDRQRQHQPDQRPPHPIARQQHGPPRFVPPQQERGGQSDIREGGGQGRDEDLGDHLAFRHAATTRLVSVPMPSIVTLTDCPGAMGPIPDGVPVKMTSPGSSVMNELT